MDNTPDIIVILGVTELKDMYRGIGDEYDCFHYVIWFTITSQCAHLVTVSTAGLEENYS